MKFFPIVLAAMFCLIFPPAVHADTLYDLTNGTLSSSRINGTFSGTFSLDASGDITSASFTISEEGLTFVTNTISNTTIFSIYENPTYQNDAVLFVSQTGPDGVTAVLTFSVLESANGLPALSVPPNLVPGATNTSFIFAEFPIPPGVIEGGTTATGGTISAAPDSPITPEPSSVILVGTSAFGMLLLRVRTRGAQRSAFPKSIRGR